MDQFAIGMGADKQAIYLDTNTLEYELVPLDLGDNVIVIMNTNKRRELADSKYNERRAECEKAVEELNQVISRHWVNLICKVLTNIAILLKMKIVLNVPAMLSGKINVPFKPKKL